MTRSLAGALAVGAVLLMPAFAPTRTNAQSGAPTPPAPKAPPPVSAKPAAPSNPTGQAQIPQVSIDQALLLVRSTLLTLNDANRSGNYTVFRDLAAPDFQARNSSADLALVFAEMRRSNLSLSGVMLLAPQLTAAPEVETGGRLHLAGFVPTRPLQVQFDLLFEASGGQWKLSNIAISTPQPQSPKAQDQAQKPPPSASAKPDVQPPPDAARRLAVTPKP